MRHFQAQRQSEQRLRHFGGLGSGSEMLLAQHGPSMQRVSVIGNSGSGKSSVARALAARLAAVHIELDAIFHQAGWTELPVEEFQQRVARLPWRASSSSST